MSSLIDKKTEYEFLIRSPGGNISVNVSNGELSFVAHWGEYARCSHNLKKHPDWNHAEELLESVCKYDRETFWNISKVLELSSYGHKIVKRIAQKQLSNCETDIAKIMEEADFWKKFLLS